MMDLRSQKKIQETKLFRRNAASADCTSDNTVRFYPAGKVCQRAEAASKDREAASGFMRSIFMIAKPQAV
jgi:hypothetical protein